MPAKYAVSSLKFIVLFSLWLFFPYNYIFIRRLLAVTGFSAAFFCVLLCIWLGLLVCCLLLLWRHTAKFTAVLFLILNALGAYFMTEYNIVIDKIMLLNAMQTDGAEAKDILTPPVLGFLLVGAVLPAFVIIKTEIRFFPLSKEIRQRSLLILAIIIFGFGIMLTNGRFTAQFLRNNRNLKYAALPINYVGAVISAGKIIMRSRQKPVSVGADAVFHPYWQNGKKNLIVLIIGETARAANFSLSGYQRPTNQELSEFAEDIFYFKDMSACGTSTAIALPCMLSADDRKHFTPGSEAYTENILDIVNRNGYHVLWRENNSGCKNTCSRVETETFCSNYQCPDAILLKDFNSKIRSINQNTLVVLHQQGSHGPAYYRRYPPEFENFRPACHTENLSRCTVTEITNAYDNSLAYTSHILAQTIQQLRLLSDSFNVIMLYVSDHGESLGENGIYLHAAPYFMAPEEQIKIPLLIWLDQNNADALKIDRACLQKKLQQPFSHDHIFHTLLGLSGISAREYNSGLDILSGCRQ